MTLCHDARVLDKGHIVYMDQYFSSLSLFEELYSRGTLAVGTCQHRQGQPRMLQSQKNGPCLKLSPGECCALRSGPTLAFKWVQKKRNQGNKQKHKNVYMLSTKHLAEMAYANRKDRVTQEPIYKPSAVVEYTNKMGGVDLSDQLMNYYHFLRRSVKWWRKLWVHMLNMVVMNAHVLNKQFGLIGTLSHVDYRYIVAAALLEYNEIEFPLAQQPIDAGDSDDEEDNVQRNQPTRGHWPERLERSANTNKIKSRKCHYCFVSAKRAARQAITRKEKSTTFQCSTCKVALCIDPCFREYHETRRLRN